MSFVEHKSQIHAIRQDDPDFKIVDGFVVHPRAMVHILPQCPNEIRDYINFAIAKGYLKLVANITERERIFMGLTK